MRFSYTLLVARCQAALAKNESSSLSLCYIIILTIRSQWYSGLRPNAEWHTYIILGLLRTLPALPQFLSMCGYIIKLSLEVCIDECTCIWPLFVIYKTISKSQTAGQAIRWLWVSMKSIVEVDYTGLDWHLFYVFFLSLLPSWGSNSMCAPIFYDRWNVCIHTRIYDSLLFWIIFLLMLISVVVVFPGKFDATDQDKLRFICRRLAQRSIVESAGQSNIDRPSIISIWSRAIAPARSIACCRAWQWLFRFHS